MASADVPRFLEIARKRGNSYICLVEKGQTRLVHKPENGGRRNSSRGKSQHGPS